MAANTLTPPYILPILNADETSFHGLVLKRFTVESVVMSLGDKITGDVYYKDNNLLFTMQEYVVYNGVKYVMVNPPTITKEGMVADNSELKGMTKYSLEFYHPMYQLTNLPFSDVAVTSSENRYLSESKKFSWIGKPNDLIAKINKNLQGTQWVIVKSSNFPASVEDELSEVTPFDDASIADALKMMYDTWELPYVVDEVASTDPLYAQGKRFKVVVGLPAEEIYPEGSQTPYVFQLGSGVGLKNNSRTPRNNKIITRISGYGSERNIPYGYPQIIWYGDQTWKYTINNSSSAPLSYPIYDGIVGGKWVKLIKHPFTRKTLMPKVYVERLFNKVSPYAVRVVPAKPSYTKMLDELYADINNKLANYSHSGAVNNGFEDLKTTIQTVVANGVAGTYEFGDAHSLQYEGKVVLASNGIISGEMYADDNNYPKFDGYTFKDVWAINTDSGAVANPNYDPTLELIDYYDAVGSDYPNQINPAAPSYESHEFEDVYPRLNEEEIVSAVPYNGDKKDYIEYSEISAIFTKYIQKAANVVEDAVLTSLKAKIANGNYYSNGYQSFEDWWNCTYQLTNDEAFIYFEYKSESKYNPESINFKFKALKQGVVPPALEWDDSMDDKGEYKQSYFKLTLPVLSFDVYACASITEQMDIYMRSGACIGCTFSVQVDWDDYKLNFFDKDGNFMPDGAQRDLVKYPKSNEQGITVIVQKDINTFGTLMPNRYQTPQAGDEFVFLGISLPLSYITAAEQELEDEAKGYMLENNVFYFDYPIKLSEHFLETHKHILSQIKPNAIMRFNFAGEQKDLYIKQISAKYGFTPLPQYDISLTDNIEVSLNQIGQAVEQVEKLGSLVNLLKQDTSKNVWIALQQRLSKVDDDTANGFIRFMKGLQVGETFTSGILGSGGVFRINDDGTSYVEVDKMYVRMKAYFDNVEIKDYQHSSGNRMVTKAGAKVCRVEWVDANGNYIEQLEQNLSSAVLFRCFFKANNGEDTVRNDFVVDANGQQDLIYCNRTVIESGLNKRWYWRAAIAKNSELTADGEAWVDLSVSDCANDSDIPMAGDDIIQLGNRTDTDRQGAIVEFVGGEDAPSYQIYQGINSYNLTNKNYISLGYSTQTNRAYMNVYGDAYIGDRDQTTFIKYEQGDGTAQHPPKVTIKAEVSIESTFGGETLQQRIEEWAPPYDDTEIRNMIADVQEQIDGAIDTWFYDYMPVHEDATHAPDSTTPLVWLDNAHTIPCYPYYDWYVADHAGAQETNTERIKHLGDIFYDNKTGYAFRFINTGTTQNPVFEWSVITDSAVIKALADAAKAQSTADHKSTIFLNNPEDQDTSKRYPTNYKKGDSWVLPSGSGEVNISNTGTERKFKKGSIITATADMVSSYNPLDWDEKVRYTDDSALDDFVDNTYSQFVTNITKQVDKKSETWYQPSNPSSAWDTDEKKASHVGDIWCDTSQNGGKKTYIWVDNGASANPRYEWKPQDVPDAVFDKIDGKAAIYVGWNDWMVDNVSQLQDKDLFIPNADVTPTGSSVTYKANKVYRWKASNSTWNEVSYTDDTKFDNYITKVLNGTSDQLPDSVVAQALHAVTTAMVEDTTEILGGLILTDLISLRNGTTVWAGISGQYQTNETGTGYKGHGIAAWYGGGMADWEVYYASLTPAQQQSATITDAYAKSLFRFDGSGYLAGGNITWNKDGSIAIKDITTIIGSDDTDVLNALATFNSAFHFNTQQGQSSTVLSIVPQVGFTNLKLNISGTLYDVATENWVNTNYVSKAFFRRLFKAFNGSTEVLPNDTTTAIDNIKGMVGLWVDQYLSALGQNSSGGGSGGGVDLTTVWNALAASTTEQINLTHLTNALSNYSTKLETVQNIAVGTGLNVGSYVVTRADGTTFTFANIGSTVIDIEDYTTSGDVLPTGSDYTYVYDGYPVEFRFASSRSRQGVITNYIVFAVNRGMLGISGSSFPYPSSLIVYSKLSSASSYTYSDTIQWGDATKFYKSLFDGEMYLPLTGGTMANTSLVTNLNADLLDGYNANDFLLKTGGTLTGNLTIGQAARTSDYYLIVQRDIDRYDSYKMEVHADAIKFLFSYFDWDTADTVTETGTLKMNASGNLLYNNNVLATQTWVSSSYLSNTATLDNIPDGTTRKLLDYVKKSYNYKLPDAADARLNSIYFIPSLYPQGSNKYEEWTVVLVDQVHVNGSWVDVDYKGDALGWYPADYDAYKNTASRGDVLLHTDLPHADVIEICTTPYDESTGTDAVWEGEGIPQGTAYSVGSTTYIYLNNSWEDTYMANIRTVRRWEKIGGNSGVSKIVVGSNTYNAIGDTITLGNYVSKAGDTMSGSLTFAYQSQSAVLGLVTTGTYAGRLQVGTKPLAYLDDIPSVNYPVTSVVNQTGDVTASQIGSALTAAGYALTDTWQQVSPSQAGYVPQFVSTSGAITSSTVEFVLVFANAQGETAPRWKTLPVNAFNDTTYSNATQSAAGLMSATDKTKLDGIESNANNYSLPLAASGTRGGVQVGFTTDGANRNYAVQLSNEKMYVNVPWTDTTYDLSGYLQKAGGTMTGQLNVKADVMVGTYDQGGGISNNKITVAGTVVASGGSSTYTGTLSATSLTFGFQGTTAALSLVTTEPYAGRLQVGSSPIAYLSDIPSISGYATQTWVNTQLGNYLPLSGGTLSGSLVIGGSDIPEESSNLASYAVAHSIKFYGNGFLIPYQMDNTNDGGMLRVRGTSEDNAILELGMWDDSGAGETIQFNYYPTTSTVTPTYTVTVPKASGTIALTSQIPTNNSQLTNGAGYITSSALSDYLPLSGGTMTGSLTVKQYIFGYNYNHAGGNAPSFVFDKPGANYTGIGANGENDTIYFSAATISDGEASWVTSYKQKWKFNGTIYQEDNAVIHAGNIGSQSVNYANSAGDADTLDGQHGSYYAAASSLGDYLPLSGGTLTGNLTVQATGNSQYVRIQSDRIRFGIESGGQEIMGLNLQMYSNASDPAAGTRLNVGSKLIAYLDDIPSVSGYYLPLSGGTMTGTLVVNAGLSKFGPSLNDDTYKYYHALYMGTHGVDHMDFYEKVFNFYGNGGGSTPTLYANGNVILHQGNWSSYIGTSSSYVGYASYATTAYGIYSVGNSNWDANTITDVLASYYGQSGGVNNIPAWYGENYGTLATFIGESNSLSMQLYGTIYHNVSNGTQRLFFRTRNNIGWGQWKELAVQNEYLYTPAVMFTTYSSISKGNAVSSSLTADDVSIHCYNGTSYSNFRVFSANNIFDGNVGIGTTSPAYKLDVNGTLHASGDLYIADDKYFYLGNSYINACDNTNFTLDFHRNNYNWPVLNWDSNGWCTMQFRDRFYLNDDNSGDDIMEYNSTNNYLYFYSKARFSTYVGINTDPDTSYRLKVNGNIYATDLFINNSSASIQSISPASGVRFWAINGSGGAAINCNGSVAAKSFVNNSDARKKDIYDYNALVDVNTIAMAPAIRFTWKDGEDRDLHCGTIAQYWNAVMPECVQLGYDGYLSMQYDIIALLASISIAKKVMNHEERITELEKENERLRTELEQLKAA